MSLSIVFFGTPEPAAASLEALIASHHRVTAVVTSPDKPSGRGMKVKPSPVKTLAEKEEISVMQPESLTTAEIVEALERTQADTFVVTAFGMILPKRILDIPKLGCVNVHFSLLPALRGAAPVQWAIIEGSTLTGVTIMKMDEGMDTGPIISQVEEPIDPFDTAGTLTDRLAVKGAELLVRTLDTIEQGKAGFAPQNDELATYASKLDTEAAHLDWATPAESISNRVRGLDPRPGAWTMMGDRRLKVWKVSISSEPAAMGPGSLDVAGGDYLFVDTATNRVMLEEVQPEGKSRMGASEFIRGYRPQTGDVLR